MKATAQEQTQLHGFGLEFLNRNSEGSKVQTAAGCYSLKHGPDSDAWRHILYLIAQCAESQHRWEQANLSRGEKKVERKDRTEITWSVPVQGVGGSGRAVREGQGWSSRRHWQFQCQQGVHVEPNNQDLSDSHSRTSIGSRCKARDVKLQEHLPIAWFILAHIAMNQKRR